MLSSSRDFFGSSMSSGSARSQIFFKWYIWLFCLSWQQNMNETKNKNTSSQKLGELEEHHNKPRERCERPHVKDWKKKKKKLTNLFPSCIIKIKGKMSWNVLELISDISSIYENSFSQWHNTLNNRGTETKHQTDAWQKYPFQTNMTRWSKHLTRLAPKHKHFASTLQTFHTANMLNDCARL